MAVIFTDGFDKYGPSGVVFGSPLVSSLLVSEWTVAGSGLSIAAPLSATGAALQVASIIGASISKTLPTNMTRLIGGVRIKSDLSSFGSNSIQGGGVAFLDTNHTQCEILINSGTGTLSFVGFSGTTGSVIDLSTFSVRQNSVHYLEWDITFGASAAYSIYIDSVLLFSGTAATNGGTGNSSINQFALLSTPSVTTFDDLYLFDSSGPTNNAVLLTNPRIETQYPIADNTKNFANGQAILGNTLSTGSNGGGDYVLNNSLNLIKVTPAVNMTVNSLFCPVTTTPVDNFTAVIYSDLTGAPNTLLGQSADTTGSTSGLMQLDLLVPYAMTGGTPYWIGVMYKTDTSVNTFGRASVAVTDILLSGYRNSSVTYNSGPPSPAPSMSIGAPSFMFYCYCTSVAANYISENRNPPPGDASYIHSSNPGDEDLYEFPALTTHPTAIYTVAVKAYARLTDTGNRAADLRMKSATTDAAGSNSGIIPTTSYEWIESFFDTDPATSSAWTESGLNSAVSGIKIAS